MWTLQVPVPTDWRETNSVSAAAGWDHVMPAITVLLLAAGLPTPPLIGPDRRVLENQFVADHVPKGAGQPSQPSQPVWFIVIIMMKMKLFSCKILLLSDWMIRYFPSQT